MPERSAQADRFMLNSLQGGKDLGLKEVGFRV